MTEKSYEQAVQVLRNRLGGRWSGVEAEGRGEMVDTLKHELGYSDREANDTIDAMVQSGALRYYRGEGAGSTPIPPVPLGTGGMNPGTGGVAAPVGMAGGYWQIGPGADETGVSGRKGQVSSGA